MNIFVLSSVFYKQGGHTQGDVRTVAWGKAGLDSQIN
jgi:hypothetical protein